MMKENEERLQLELNFWVEKYIEKLNSCHEKVDLSFLRETVIALSMASFAVNGLETWPHSEDISTAIVALSHVIEQLKGKASHET